MMFRTLIIFVMIVTVMMCSIATATHAEDPTVGVMWVGKSAMTKRVMLGFSREMKDIAPSVKVIRKIELPSMTEGRDEFFSLEKTVDGVVFLRSNGAKFLGSLNRPTSVPCFVGGCNNPVYLGAVRSLQAPEGTVTGVTYFIPYKQRFDVIASLFPNIKSVVLLTEKGHPGTPIDRRGTQAQCKALGIAYHEVEASNSNELLEGLKQVVNKVDLVILSSTALALDTATALLMVTNPAKKPMFSFSEKPANFAAVAALTARDEYLGRLLAKSVVDVVVNGKPVSQVPVKIDPEPRLVVNKKMMNALGLSFPSELLSTAKIID
jgi:putative ABC transport system substrate-binding protein